jgi:hypothetical protein
MERRRKSGRRSSSGGVASSSSSTPKATHAEATSLAWAHIQALIESDGQIIIGTIAPIHGAAVAHDGNKTLVMLKRQPGEAIEKLLTRLDAAISIAKSTGARVDEINATSSNRRYEI